MLIDSWKAVDLGEVVTLQRGYDLPCRSRKPGSVPIATSSGVSDTHSEARVSGPGVVTGRYGTIGEVFFIREDFWPLNTTLFVKDFHGNDPLFISYLLRTIDFHTHSGKSGVPGVNRNDLHALTVRVPKSTDEKRAIAGALGDVDALLGALTKLIAKKRDLKQAAMQQLLTGQTRLPGFSGEWGLDNVRNLASITTGARNTQDRREDGKYPFFVRSSTVERINSYSFDGEAVLTAGDGVGTGKIFHYIKGKFDFHQRVYKISDFSERVDGYFFYLCFSTNFFQRIMSMTAKSSVDSVRMEVIADMDIPLPSPQEQRAIANVLSDMDAEIAALERRLAKTRALKQGMMQELLTGKARLIEKIR